MRYQSNSLGMPNPLAGQYNRNVYIVDTCRLHYRERITPLTIKYRDMLERLMYLKKPPVHLCNNSLVYEKTIGNWDRFALHKWNHWSETHALLLLYIIFVRLRSIVFEKKFLERNSIDRWFFSRSSKTFEARIEGCSLKVKESLIWNYVIRRE